jgi:hypothetical protein
MDNRTGPDWDNKTGRMLKRLASQLGLNADETGWKKDLAEKIGIAQTQLTTWVRQDKPLFNYIIAALDKYNVSPADAGMVIRGESGINAFDVPPETHSHWKWFRLFLENMCEAANTGDAALARAMLKYADQMLPRENDRPTA